MECVMNSTVALPNSTYLYIPLISFVFGFPLLVIAILCIIQYRNGRLQQGDSERLHNRTPSTYSQVTIYTGITTRSSHYEGGGK